MPGYGTVGRRDLAIVVALFTSSVVLYALLGVRFDASTLPRFMQFIDERLLKENLLESLWYYHGNPPLLNLFTGIGLKLFPDGADVYFSTCFHILGLLLVGSVYVLTLKLSASRLAAAIVSALLVFSPGFVLYQNWLMYTLPATALLTMSALALHQFVQKGTARWGFIFFGLLALLLLTRSMFHLAWMVLVVAALLMLLEGRRRQVLLTAALPVLLVAGWYGKNYYYFGSFSSSTWMGLGLSNISTLLIPGNELLPLVEQGRLSPFAMVSRYERPDILFSAQQPSPTGIAVLDDVRKSSGAYNYNSSHLIAIDRLYRSDGLKVIRQFPARYAVGIVVANRLFFSPSSMNLYFNEKNRAAVWPMERVFNPLLYAEGARAGHVQQPHFGFNGRYWIEVNTSVALIFMWVVVLGYGYAQARRVLLSPESTNKPRAITIGFIVMTALYVYVLATTLELGENYRYRFMVEPLFLVLAATAIVHGLKAIARARAAARTVTPPVVQ